jgi:protein TonB
MTNNEILKASLLDIIFDKRNKAYGAYALRRDYNNRLFISIGIASSIILSFILINALKKNSDGFISTATNKEGIVIRTIELPVEKKPETHPAKQAEKKATVKYISNIKIVDKVKDPIPTQDSIENKRISTQNQQGKPEDKIVDKPTNSTNGSSSTSTEKPREVELQESAAEYPGGQAALLMFLKRNLNTPSELEAGDKKTVLIRFKVDADGSVSSFEIAQSGGSEFDREVIRVCKKMPRWKPAVQNGVNVPVTYMVPVTFIGLEE